MKSLIEELYLTNRGFVTDDYDYCLEYIDEHELPLTYHTYASGQEVWDSWVVPQKWSVEEGLLKSPDGEVLVDYEDHPLHLISYSESFEGWVSREELLDHLHWHGEIDEAIPWHFSQNYRPWDSDWGFCVPKTLVDELSAEEYYVSIDTTFEDDEMRVAEHHISGQRDETVLLVAHLDHTGMANDDLSGVAGGIELCHRLHKQQGLSYSYKFLIVQEILGSAAYLADEYTPDSFEYGIFLEMLGNDNRLLLQNSFEGNTHIDMAAEHALETRNVNYELAGFRERIGNDELVFESPGFEIPMVSISRFPYPEYHTHLDDPSILSEKRMIEAVETVMDIVAMLDNDAVPYRNFIGIPSLANPKYDLYLEPEIVAEQYDIDPQAVDLFRDRIFQYINRDYSILDIARHLGLPFDFVHEYISDLCDVGLIELKEL